MHSLDPDPSCELLPRRIAGQRAEEHNVYGGSGNPSTNKAIVWIMISSLTIVLSLTLIYTIVKSGRSNPNVGYELGGVLRGMGAVLAQTAKSISEAQSA